MLCIMLYLMELERMKSDAEVKNAKAKLDQELRELKRE